MEGYKYIGYIGQGAFADVTKYKSCEDNRKVAVKRLKKIYYDDTDIKHRFKKEIELTMKLEGSDNIIPILDFKFNEAENEYWYMMPAAEMNLNKFIEKNNSKLGTAE